MFFFKLFSMVAKCSFFIASAEQFKLKSAQFLIKLSCLSVKEALQGGFQKQSDVSGNTLKRFLAPV